MLKPPISFNCPASGTARLGPSHAGTCDVSAIRFDGRVVLITGAARGLGHAYAEVIAARGGTVALHDAGVDMEGAAADPSIAQDAANRIAREGGRAHAFAQDLSTRDACEELVAEVRQRLGRIDALIHSAGLVAYTGLVETPPERIEQLLAVNVAAPLWLCRAVLPLMREQQYGRIVLTVSGHGAFRTGATDLTVYATTKAAQAGLTYALADEGAAYGVKVNAISPAARTRMYRREVAAGEMTPQQVAPAVAYLASESCAVSGVIVRAANGHFSLGRYAITDGIDVAGAELTPDTIARRWGEIEGGTLRLPS